MKTERQEGRNNIHETTGKEEIVEEENKEGRLIQRRKIQLGLEKENVNNRKSQEKGLERNKISNAQIKKKENEKEENTDMKKEKVKRGRKRHTEKGLLEGEQSIKKFLVTKEEAVKQETPKRKRQKVDEKEEIIFGQEETPGKRIKTMLYNDPNRRKRIEKGGKIKRMVLRFEKGEEGKEYSKEEISFLGKVAGNSSGKQEVTVKKQIERINSTKTLIPQLIPTSKINSYEKQNGDFRNSNLGHENESFNGKHRKLINGFDNRGGDGVQCDVNSVLSNQEGRLMTRWEGPIRSEYTIQLGNVHGGNKL